MAQVACLRTGRKFFPWMGKQNVARLCVGQSGNSVTGEKHVSKQQSQITTDGNSYQVPEYYEHNEWTYVDFMISMKKYRLPQPSAK